MCEEAAGSIPSGSSTASFRKMERYFRFVLCRPCIHFPDGKLNPSKLKAKARLGKVNDYPAKVHPDDFCALKYSQVKNNLVRICTNVITGILKESHIPHEAQGQCLFPAVVWRSRDKTRWIWTRFLPLPSKLSFFPSRSSSSPDKSATCSSNLAPSTGPLWYQFTYEFTCSRNPGSPCFISPTCFECHISWGTRTHTHIRTHTYKCAHSCALPFHCRHNSQFCLWATLIPPPCVWEAC